MLVSETLKHTVNIIIIIDIHNNCKHRVRGFILTKLMKIVQNNSLKEIVAITHIYGIDNNFISTYGVK